MYIKLCLFSEKEIINRITQAETETRHTNESGNSALSPDFFCIVISRLELYENYYEDLLLKAELISQML